MNKLIKISLTLLMLLLMAVNGMGQNLVPNPSFEDYTLCPDDWYQIDRIDNWEAYKGSPDYFNSCEPTNSFSTPQNLMGNQSPASGNSYIGIIFYSRDGIGADEMIGTQLSQSLSIGVKYYISFKVILKYNNSFSVCCGNNKIGAKFTTQSFNFPNPPAVNTNPPIINDMAHIWTDSIIVDTLDWTQIFGSFTADSSYNQIIIGNFFSNPNISISDIIPANDFGYYYVDDVCVSTDSSYTANYIYTGVEEEFLKDKFTIYPNPVNGYFYISQSYTEPYDLIIHNTLGQKLYEEKDINSNTKLINTTQYTKGLLIINIKSKNTSFTYKLLNP